MINKTVLIQTLYDLSGTSKIPRFMQMLHNISALKGRDPEIYL